MLYCRYYLARPQVVRDVDTHRPIVEQALGKTSVAGAERRFRRRSIQVRAGTGRLHCVCSFAHESGRTVRMVHT
jgi:hypothetical protein